MFPSVSLRETFRDIEGLGLGLGFRIEEQNLLFALRASH